MSNNIFFDTSYSYILFFSPRLGTLPDDDFYKAEEFVNIMKLLYILWEEPHVLLNPSYPA